MIFIILVEHSLSHSEDKNVLSVLKSLIELFIWFKVVYVYFLFAFTKKQLIFPKH